MKFDYYEYLNSPEWKEVRKLALKRAGHKCQICGRIEDLDVHHNTYENLGNEREHLEDIVVLCSEHHQLYHEALAEVEKITDQRLEEALLGALLQQTPAFIQTLSYLPTEVFTSNFRREIFSYLLSRAAEEQAVDSAILSSYLGNRKLLRAEEAENLLNTWVSRCIYPQNADLYANELYNLYLRRQIQQLPARITRLHRNNKETVAELIDKIQTEVQSIGNANNMNKMTLASDIMSHMFEENESAKRAIYCNFYDLDAMTGGLQRSDLIIVAGRPSIGKTAFCLNIAFNIANSHHLPVCIFSLEMSKEQVILRLLSTEAHIESGRLRTSRISPNEWEPLSLAIRRIVELPIYIDDRSSLSVSEIRSKARQVMFEHQGLLGLIVIDYLQLIAGDNDENRVQELAKITRSLKSLAKDLNVPVLALSQLSRNVESRNNKRPMLSDLRESGSIEQEADLVIMIYRDEYYHTETPDRGIAEIIVAKHRNGPVGTVKLLFDPQLACFRNFTYPRQG